MKIPKRELQRMVRKTAIHEAGHAVMAAAFGFRVDMVHVEGVVAYARAAGRGVREPVFTGGQTVFHDFANVLPANACSDLAGAAAVSVMQHDHINDDAILDAYHDLVDDCDDPDSEVDHGAAQIFIGAYYLGLHDTAAIALDEDPYPMIWPKFTVDGVRIGEGALGRCLAGHVKAYIYRAWFRVCRFLNSPGARVAVGQIAAALQAEVYVEGARIHEIVERNVAKRPGRLLLSDASMRPSRARVVAAIEKARLAGHLKRVRLPGVPRGRRA